MKFVGMCFHSIEIFATNTVTYCLTGTVVNVCATQGKGLSFF